MAGVAQCVAGQCGPGGRHKLSGTGEVVVTPIRTVRWVMPQFVQMIARIHEENMTGAAQSIAGQCGPGGRHKLGRGGEVAVIPSGTLSRIVLKLVQVVTLIHEENMTGAAQSIASQCGPGGGRNPGGGREVVMIPVRTLGRVVP